MSMMQIAILGVTGAVLAIQLKQSKPEYAVVFCIGISVLIFFSVYGKLKTILSTLQEVTTIISFDATYLTTLLKMLGVTYVAEFSSGICKDAGYQSLAAQIEIFSKLTILVLSLPILVSLLKTIQGFMA